MRIEIRDMDHMGNGIGKIDNKVVFVPKTIPGDVCDIEIIKDNRRFDVGKVVNIIDDGSKRVLARCPYYDKCGGCNISNLSYQEQLEFKTNKVKNIFKKYLNIEIDPRVVGSDKEYGYRNKITYHGDMGKIGLVSEFGGIIEIDECLLVSDRVNNLYKIIKERDLSKVNKIMIKECNNGLILSIDGDMDISELEGMCLSIYKGNRCVCDNGNGYISVDGIRYRVSNDSFFQINTNNIVNLYNEIVRYGEFTKEDRVIDLYCGVGSISLYVARYVDSVFGIEIVDDAIEDAWENARNNKINNVSFLGGDVSKLMNDEVEGDVLIVDPPRSGLDKHTVSVINERKFKKVIYVSCDPMTLVRDIGLLDNYVMENISVVDMFPQTHHVESVILLQKKK